MVEPVRLPGQNGSEWVYADFLSRILAGTIDSIIFLIAVSIPFTLFLLFYAPILFSTINITADDISTAGEYKILGAITVGVSYFFLSYAFYFCGFISSEWRATPGKMLFDMIVVDAEGKQLTFWGALVNPWANDPNVVGALTQMYYEQIERNEDLPRAIVLQLKEKSKPSLP